MIDGDANILPFRSRKNQINSPISLDAFCMQVQQYSTDIIAVQKELRDAHYLFRASIGDIWPDQCEDIISLVRTLSRPIQDFCTLMSETESLPNSIIPLSYSLMTKLHYTNKQIIDLIRLLTEFFVVCRTSLAQSDEQQQKLAGQMKQLSQSCDELRYKVCTLFNKINQDNFELASI